MNTVKKTLLICLCVIAVVTASVLGTLAWLTDQETVVEDVPEISGLSKNSINNPASEIWHQIIQGIGIGNIAILFQPRRCLRFVISFQLGTKGVRPCPVDLIPKRFTPSSAYLVVKLIKQVCALTLQKVIHLEHPADDLLQLLRLLQILVDLQNTVAENRAEVLTLAGQNDSLRLGQFLAADNHIIQL